MKITVFASLALMLGIGARAENWQKVSVCVENASEVNDEEAKMIASKIFVQARVELEWQEETRPCHSRRERVIEISLSIHTPADRLPGALAYALPYGGRRIVVFCDRIEHADPEFLPRLLAHIMAHEIAHILQGYSQHSERGVMKARWDKRDYAQMKVQPLAFTPKDIQLVRDGLAGYEKAQARRVRLAAYQLVIALEIASKVLN